MSRAWVCTELSDDLSGLHLQQQTLPACAPGDVVVDVHAAALNFPDLLMTRGLYQLKPTLPFVAGMEGAGVVRSVGADVKGWTPGQRVCFSTRHGAFAEQVLLESGKLRALPAGFDFAEGAAYGVTAITAWVALVRRAALQRGETLLVHGASGGTGLAAVQLGVHLGATVIATGSSAAKLLAASQAGAHHTIFIGGETSPLSTLRDRVRELTDGHCADVIFDPVGGDLFDASLRCIAWGGRLLVVGFAGGRIATLPSNLPLIKGFSVVGVRAGEYGRRDPQAGAHNQQAVNTLAARGVFRPLIGARFAFDEAPAAYRAMAARTVAGKIVLDMGRDASPT
jgi:NADPH2:quinone reductase